MIPPAFLKTIMGLGRLFPAACFALLALSAPAAPAAAFFEGGEESVQLSANGSALVPITVSPDAPPEVVGLAEDLAEGLKKITGGDFTVSFSKNPGGIVFGTAKEWPGVLPPSERPASQSSENFIVRSEKNLLWMVGETPLALQDLVWTFFHHLGFRQFFPGEHWEVWPSQPSLSVSIDSLQSPSFYSRALHFTGIGGAIRGLLRPTEKIEDYLRYLEAVDTWKVRNRLVSGFKLNTVHANIRIISRNPEHFQKHPDDIIGPNESGAHRKFDSSRPTLLNVAVEDTLRLLEADPSLDSISMEPSDGPGWREDSPLGSPSNQALALANHVAREIRSAHPDVKVGMLAYNEHSPPPDLRVEPNVVIKVQTGFLRQGYTVERVLKGWRDQGAAELAIGDYLFDVATTDMPGLSKATDLDRLSRSLPEYYDFGVRYWSCEASRSWIPHGPGFYFLSRALWDVQQSAEYREILDDVYQHSFGPAASEMKAFIGRYLLREGRPRLSDDLLGRMYQSLLRSLDSTDDPAIQRRVVDFAIYTRYLELLLAFRRAEGAARQERFLELQKFVYRFSDSPAINAGLFYWQYNRNPEFELAQPGPDWPVAPWSIEQARATIRAGMENNQLNDFEPVGFSFDLVPYQGPASEFEGGDSILITRGNNPLFLFGDKPGTFEFEVTGAITYANRGPVRIRLFALENPIPDEVVAEIEIPADRTPHPVQLKSPFRGLHRAEFSDGGGVTRISWPPGQSAVLSLSPDMLTRIVSGHRYSGVFYVPKGTKVIGGFSARNQGKLIAPDGSVVLDLSTRESDSPFMVDVPPGADGAVWKIADGRLGLEFLTVPPVIARTSRELLIPQEAQSQ